MSTILEAESHPSSERTRGGFFAVHRSAWAKACDLGMSAAIAHVVLARGTGRDNEHTTWSADAIERKTGVSWRRAKKALTLLQQHGVLETVRRGARPKYRLIASESPAWVWLPNEVVDGVEGHASPLERIRQTGDVMTLRLFVDLYSEHYLRDDGGVSRRVVYGAWTRHTVGDFGEYVVFGFVPPFGVNVPDSPVSDPHKRALTEAEKEAGLYPAARLAQRLGQLEALRLFEWVPTLWEHDGADAEPIHPLHRESSIHIERELAAAAVDAGRALVTHGQVRWAYEQGCTLFAPVLRHMQNVSVVSIARLTHRPRTRWTAAWFEALHREGGEYIRHYEALVKRATNDMSLQERSHEVP